MNALKLDGNDNFGCPRQDFAGTLASCSDVEYVALAEERIWLSAHGVESSDWHWHADACYAEAVRRGKPELYDQAWRQAQGIEERVRCHG